MDSWTDCEFPRDAAAELYVALIREAPLIIFVEIERV
jgi:hypothetical protein